MFWGTCKYSFSNKLVLIVNTILWVHYLTVNPSIYSSALSCLSLCVCIYLCLSFYLIFSVCLSAYLSICLNVNPSIWHPPPVFLSFWLTVRPTIWLFSVCPAVSISVDSPSFLLLLFACLLGCLFLWLAVHLSLWYYPSVYLLARLYFCQTLHHLICASCLSVCLSVWLSIYPSVCCVFPHFHLFVGLSGRQR